MRPTCLGLAFLLLAATAAVASYPTIFHEGRAYVDLEHIAQNLGTRLEGGSDAIRTRLRTPRGVVTFTRNWSQIAIDGRPVLLDGPVLVKTGVWLVPESFVATVLPRLAPTPPAALPRAAATVTLDEWRLRSYPSFTRVVLETSGAVMYRVEQTGPKEARVRLVGLVGDARAESLNDGLVDQVRLERAGADALLRVIFDGTPGELRVNTLADPPRLLLDFHYPASAAGERSERAAPLRLIVLDAGHGGPDSGATGPTGLAEKDLVLEVTRRVAKLVEVDLGVRVVLTRSDDTFIPLRDRTSTANRERADLFVSIHANAHRQIDSAGVETYFLSSEATDSSARQAAAVENSVVQLEVPASGRGRADIVKAILWDLAQSEFQAESSRLAEIVQDSMTRSLRMPNRGVKQAGFYVLGGAAMPAILVEIGFVTNPREERRLREARYRDEIARAIFAGLAEYKRYWDQRMRTAADRGR